MEATPLQRAQPAGAVRRRLPFLPLRQAAAVATAVVVAALAAGLTVSFLGAAEKGIGADVYDGCYLLLLAIGGTSCIVRGLERGAERAAWLAMGTGLWLWCAGEVLGEAVPIAGVPVEDMTYLGFYACVALGVVLLVRSEGSTQRDITDAAIALFGMSSVWAWLVLDGVLAADDGPLPAIQLASPVADIALAALALAAVQRLGWLPSSRWLLIAGAFVAIAVADSFYLVAVAEGRYAPGAMFDFLWPLGAVALGAAAWLPPQRKDLALPESFSLLVAVAAILAALIVVLVDHFQRLSLLVIGLAAATLLLGVVRITVTHARQLSAESSLRTEATRTVGALAAAVDAKDHYTRYHSEHVSLYARAIAERLGLSPDRVAQVEVAGQLHDVGKITVSDAVLLKPGRLTEEDWDVMRTHAAEGERIVRSVGLFDMAPWIRHHHERWDGGGYPDDLRAEESPLEARILAGADSLDAMTTSRSYREPLSHGEARSEILANAGRQFDPAVAHAIVELIDEGLCAQVALAAPLSPPLAAA